MSRASQKSRVDARADLKKDGKPVLYRPAAPGVDSVLGEPPASAPADVQTYAIVEALSSKYQRNNAGPFGHTTGSIVTAASQLTVPAIDFPTPPAPGATFWIGPSGQETHPVDGGPGVQKFKVMALVDTVPEEVDDVLYIVAVEK